MSICSARMLPRSLALPLILSDGDGVLVDRYSQAVVDILLQLVATATRSPPPPASTGPGKRRQLLEKRQLTKTREVLVKTLAALELQHPFEDATFVTGSLLAMEALSCVWVPLILSLTGSLLVSSLACPELEDQILCCPSIFSAVVLPSLALSNTH